MPIDNPGLNADLSDEVIGEICPMWPVILKSFEFFFND